MTSRFTCRDDPAVDVFVKHQLDKITQSVSDLLGRNLSAVILTGGFGRGEGSVRVLPDGKFRVVNDYDIEVVYREPCGIFLSKLLVQLRYSRKLIRLAEQLSRQLDVKQIDLCLRSGKSFRASHPPLLADYDIKYGNTLLFGDRNPVDLMPAYSPADISPFEGTWLLRNRGIGLLLAKLYLDNDELPDDKQEYFYIEIGKAVLAMGDALFVASGTYNHSYAVRADTIDDVIPDDLPCKTELGSLYRQAARQKLLPVDAPFDGASPADLWNRINTLYCSFFLHYESSRLGTSYREMPAYARMVAAASPGINMKRRAKILFERMRGTLDRDAAHIAHIKHDRECTVAMTFLLLSSQLSAGNYRTDLAEAYRLAGLELPTGTETDPWRVLTRSFLLLIHPKGELGRALRSTRSNSS